MKRFTATLTKSGAGRIISVMADNAVDAKNEIVRQLSKPGRTDVLKQWKRNGKHIVDTTDEFAK